MSYTIYQNLTFYSIYEVKIHKYITFFFVYFLVWFVLDYNFSLKVNRWGFKADTTVVYRA